MSKILPATASTASVVTALGVPVTAAEILSLGKQQSSGILILQDGRAWYIASSAPDIKTTIEKVASALTEIANALTAIGTGMTGPTTAPPGSLPTSVSSINAVVTQLNTLKEALI